MTTTTTAALTLTGITKARSECACCGRTLGKVFQLSDGNDYGRTCAAKLTGYKVTDQAVRIAARLAAVKAQRRAEGWTAETFTDYAWRELDITTDGRLVLVPGAPHVSDWAEEQARDLWAD